MNHSYDKSIRVILVSIAISAALFTSLGTPLAVSATTTPSNTASPQYTLLEPLPCVSGNGVDCTPGTLKESVNFKDYVQYVFNLVIALAAVAAVFMTVWGGFLYMTSGSIQKKSDGLSIVKNALGGLVLALCSFLILRTIDPRLVEIPTTLVTPLEVKVDKDNTIANFFGEISAQASKYQSERSDLKTEIATAKTSVEEIEAKLNSLSQTYWKAVSEGDTETANKTAAEMQSLNVQSAKIRSSLSVKNSWVAMLSTLQMASSLANDPNINTSTNIQTKMDYIDTQYSAAMSQLRGISNPPDPAEKQALDDARNFSLGVLTIQKYSVLSGGSASNIISGVIGSMKGLGIGIVGGPIGVTVGTYKGFEAGYKNSANKNLVDAIGSNVINGYGKEIKNVELKNRLTEIANQVIEQTKK